LQTKLDTISGINEVTVIQARTILMGFQAKLGKL